MKFSTSKFRHNRGFTLVELGIVIAAIAILATLGARLAKNYTMESRGSFIGQTMLDVHTAAEDYARRNRAALIDNATGTPTAIPGVAAPLTPTTAELFALQHLTKNVDPAIPRAGNIVITYTAVPAGCVPINCAVRILTHINGPVLETDANAIAIPVLSKALQVAGGKAGRSDSTDPANLHGLNGQWTFPNPVAGNPVGIFGMLSSTADVGIDAFVRIQDVRNPDLQGNFTVAGAVIHNGATTHTGATTLNAATTVNSSLTTVGAAGTLAVGGTTTLSGATTINNTANVTGRITAGADVVATGMVRGDRVTPTGSYLIGAACADEGSIARRAGGLGGAVMCVGGAWQAMMTVASAGTACAPNGSEAQDSSGVKLTCVNGTYRALSTLIVAGTVGSACTVPGQPSWDFSQASPTQLICRGNPAGGSARWMRIQDITTHMIFVSSWEVTNGAVINKPTCSVATGQTVTPIIMLRGKVETSTDVGFNRYATDNGSAWGVVLTDASSNALGTALAEIFCYYN